ncbi:MAG: M28 family peptidase [Planctomycetota bacterium]
MTTPVDGDRAYAHVKRIVEMSPRPPGSPALVACGDYIIKQLEQLDLQPQKQVFKDPKERRLKLPFRNIWVQIDGEDPENGPILVLGSHYDSKLCEGHPNAKHNFEFKGAVDGAGSSGLLLELARVLKDRQNLPNIWLVWFDGEESLEFDWNIDRALFGSRHFVKTMAADKQRFPKGLARRMKVMVLLDLVGAKDYKIDKDTASFEGLVQIFTAAARELGQEHRVFKTESSMTDDHIPFRNYQVRVIDLIDLHYRAPNEDGTPPNPNFAAWWHTKEDTLDKLSREGLKFAGDLVWVALPKIEEQFYKPK